MTTVGNETITQTKRQQTNETGQNQNKQGKTRRPVDATTEARSDEERKTQEAGKTNEKLTTIKGMRKTGKTLS